MVIGLYKGSKSIPVAQEHGFQVLEVSEAVQKADIIFFATPDLKSASIYESRGGPSPEERKGAPCSAMVLRFISRRSFRRRTWT